MMIEIILGAMFALLAIIAVLFARLRNRMIELEANYITGRRIDEDLDTRLRATAEMLRRITDAQKKVIGREFDPRPHVLFGISTDTFSRAEIQDAILAHLALTVRRTPAREAGIELVAEKIAERRFQGPAKKEKK